MNRILLLGCVLALTFVTARAQDADSAGWSKAIKYAGYDAPLGPVVRVTDGYVFAGEIDNFPGNETAPVLIKIDDQGSPVWQYKYQTTPKRLEQRIQALTATSDGGLIAGGWWYTASQYSAWVIKLDAGGKVQWQEIIAAPDQQEVRVIRQVSDGYVLGVAISKTAKTNDLDVGLIKLKNDGSLAHDGPLPWAKRYDLIQYDIIEDIAVASDGGLIVAVHQYLNDRDELTLMKTDSGGAVEWQKSYGQGTANLLWTNGVLPQTDGYVVHGSAENAVGLPTSGYAMKVDLTGAIVWKKAYSGTVGTQMIGGTQLQDGSLALVGNYNVVYLSTPVPTRQALVLQVKSDGTLGYTSGFGGPKDDSLGSVVAAPGGGLVACGYTLSFGTEPNRTNGWAIRLNAAGKLPSNAIDATVPEFTTTELDVTAFTRNVTVTTITPTPTLSDTNVSRFEVNAEIITQVP